MRSNQLPVYAIRLWFPDMFGNFNIVKYHKFTCNPLFTRTAKIRLDCTKSDGKIEIFLSFLDGQKIGLILAVRVQPLKLNVKTLTYVYNYNPFVT